MPDVARLVQDVNRSGRPRLLQAGDQAARLVPARPTRRPRPSRPRRPAFSRDDALFHLIGLGTGTTPGGVSGRKHEALARAYRPR